ncbi:MAG TPA: GPP34 family phosphoprotein [Pseudonocardiaceae bacterium]|nr:GPP34 family phosphoprotein [Pseudonocardiaceae bacterium]
MGTLTLPERAYLLGQEGREGDLATVVRAAVLAELSLRECLVEEDGTVRPSPTRRTGDPLLDGVLRTMSEDKPRSWRGWMRRGARPTLCAVRDRLAATGVITAETGRVLGIFPTTKVTADPARLAAERSAVWNAIRGTGPVSTADATLVALLSVGEVGTVLSRRDRGEHKARIAEFTDSAGAAVPALKHALRQIRMSRAGAYGGGG